MYRDTRRLLADELGIEPGPQLRELEATILAQTPELDVQAVAGDVAKTAPTNTQVSNAGNLPIPPTSLVGREEDLRALVALLVGPTFAC